MLQYYYIYFTHCNISLPLKSKMTNYVSSGMLYSTHWLIPAYLSHHIKTRNSVLNLQSSDSKLPKRTDVVGHVYHIRHLLSETHFLVRVSCNLVLVSVWYQIEHVLFSARIW